jgi:uncharacterized membrane protein
MAFVSSLLLAAVVSGYVLHFCHLTFQRYNHFGAGAFDLGIYDQAVWLIRHGHAPFVTVRGLHLLADHFTPVLYWLAPFYWLWGSPKVLLVAQTLAFGAGALPVYGCALRRLQNPLLGVLFAVAYLLYPALQWMNLFDFHPDAFLTPLLLAAVYFLEMQRYRLFAVAVSLALLCKETAGLSVVALGVYARIVAGWRVGVATFTAGVLGVVGALHVMQHFNHGAPSAYLSLYQRYGDSLSSIAANVLLHPIATLQDLNTEQNQIYLARLLKPVAYFPLAAPELLALALPALLLNLLNERPQAHDVYFQYNAPLIPFVFAAAIAGFEQCRAWGEQWTQRKRMVSFLLTLLFAACVCAELRHGPLRTPRDIFVRPLSSTEARRVREVLSTIPPRAAVSAQAVLVPHLSHRRQIYLFPNPFQPAAWGNTPAALRQQMMRDFQPDSPQQLQQRLAQSEVDYVVLCPKTTLWPLTAEQFQHFARALRNSPHYGVIVARHDVVVFQRGADAAAGRRLLQHRHVKGLDTFTRNEPSSLSF